MLQEHKVIGSMEEFKRLTFAQIKFFIDKRDEYKTLTQKNQELNERFNKKKKQ